MIHLDTSFAIDLMRERGKRRDVVLSYPDERFAPTYAEILSWALRHGSRVAAMDTLIAAGALAEGAPLLTRNVKDFARIPGLRVETY